MSRYVRHFFVCQMQRAPGGKPSCSARGGPQLFALLQQTLSAHPELWGKAQVTACECLGPCFDGCVCVVYPQGIWYAGVTPTDAREIAESHLVGGNPVERLLYHWQE